MYEHSTINFLDARPCSQRAEYIREFLSQKLLESLEHLIDVCEEVIDHKPSLRDLTLQELYCPIFFCINAEWLEAVQEKNIEKIQACSSLLITVLSIPKLPIFMNFNRFCFSQPLIDIFIKHSTMTFPKRESVYVKAAPTDCYFRSVEQIKKTLMIIQQIDQEIYGEMQKLIVNYVLLDSNRVEYGTSFNLFGMIFLRAFENDHSLLYIIEMLVHETAHHCVFALSVIDSLVLNPPTQLFKAPFRKDPRPMMGIYHALFVLGRLIYAFSKLIKHTSELQISSHDLEKKIKDFEQRFKSSLELIQSQAQLTEMGSQLVMSTQSMVQQAIGNELTKVA